MVGKLTPTSSHPVHVSQTTLMQTSISSLLGVALSATPPASYAAPALFGWKPGQGPRFTKLNSISIVEGLE